MHALNQPDGTVPSPNDAVPREGSSVTRPGGDHPPDLAPDVERDRPSVDAVESEVWAGRTSWKHFAPRLTLWVAVNGVVAFVASWGVARSEAFTRTHLFWFVAAAVVLSGIPVMGGIALRVLGCRYRLTSQRLFIARGIISQTLDQTELVRVDDVRIYKSLVDRLLGLGTVAIVSTDATDKEITMEGIAGSDQVAEAIRARMRAMRKKSLYVENI